MHVAVLCALAPAIRQPVVVSRYASPRMGLFDGLASSFANDDTLGDREEAGLSRQAKQTTITWRGPKPTGFMQQQQITQTTAVEGQSLAAIARSAGVPVEFACMTGSCGICDVVIDGKRMPACTAVAVSPRAARARPPARVPTACPLRRSHRVTWSSSTVGHGPRSGSRPPRRSRRRRRRRTRRRLTTAV